MISLKGHRIIDLSVELISRVYRLDATVEDGTRDVYGMPWMVEESINEADSTIEHLIACNVGDPIWPIGGISGHMGSHTQLGVGHNDNWSGLPEGMLGLWDLPVDAYYGEAAVCIFNDLKAEPILPKHLSNVREGDIVLMGSPHTGKDTPWLDGETAYWLAQEKKIKLLGVGVPGIGWETRALDPEPDNCPTHRAMTGNNIPIAYPFDNVHTLTRDRCFYMGLPLNVERMEGTWIRAIAIEEV
jgi:kynurenine formamidase